MRLFFALSLAPDPLLVRLWGGDFTFGDDCFACSSDSSLGASADAFLVSFADRGDSPVKPYLVDSLLLTLVVVQVEEMNRSPCWWLVRRVMLLMF